MIRSTLSSMIALSAAAVVFAPEGLSVAAEEQEIAKITHLPVEEVEARLKGISETFGVPMDEVTEVFYNDAKAGLLPTAEEEASAQSNQDDLLDDILDAEGDNEDFSNEE